jgi:hypothetical protein
MGFPLQNLSRDFFCFQTEEWRKEPLGWSSTGVWDPLLNICSCRPATENTIGLHPKVRQKLTNIDIFVVGFVAPGTGLSGSFWTSGGF